MSSTGHVPVLLKEVLEALRPRPGGCYLDATLGAGGHAAALLEKAGAGAVIVGMDRDPAALEAAKVRLSPWGAAVRFVHWRFDRLDLARKAADGRFFDGILVDLGVSSMQLDNSQRGFSFQVAGPLDMRMDPTRGETAAELIQRSDVRELERIFRSGGEERFARRLARAVHAHGAELATTADLAGLVERTVSRRGPRHPATRVFMALRMAVNAEMESLSRFLEQVTGALSPEGRFAAITFHSLEDRIVKRWGRGEHRVTSLSKKPLTAGAAELKENPRSRSAKLRSFEKNR